MASEGGVEGKAPQHPVPAKAVRDVAQTDQRGCGLAVEARSRG